jgi:hypothetical protein
LGAQPAQTYPTQRTSLLRKPIEAPVSTPGRPLAPVPGAPGLPPKLR